MTQRNRALPIGWAKATVGDVADYINGLAFNAQDWGAVGRPIIRIQNLTGSSENLNFTAKDFDERFLVSPGTILVSWSATLDAFIWRGPEGVLNQHIFKVVPERRLVDREYLFWALKDTIREMRESAKLHGSTMKHINRGPFLSHELPLPPLPEQRRIVARLTEMQARSRATREALESIPPLLERFRQSVLAAAFRGDLTADWRAQNPDVEAGSVLLDRIRAQYKTLNRGFGGKAAAPTEGVHSLDRERFPATWALAELQELCEPGRAITYGILKPGPELAAGVPYVRVADFPKGEIVLSTVRNTSKAIADSYKRSVIRTGDILLSIRGSVGRTCRVLPELDGGNITQDTVRISIDALVDTNFVEFALQAPSTRNRMDAATKGVAVRGINVGDVRVLQIPLPPVAEQLEISRRLVAALSWINAVKQSVIGATRDSRAFDQSVLAKAFRGELVPQDPNDEPASVLLERIRAEREAAGGTKRRGRRAAGAAT